MKQFNAIIHLIRPIASDYYEMQFRWGKGIAIPAPGQFVTIRISNSSVPLLRRPFAISKFDPSMGITGIIFQVRGKATQLLSRCKSGDEIDVIGPLGRGFKEKPDLDTIPVCIAGGIGLGPVLYWTSELTRMDRKPIFIFGARTGGLVPEPGIFNGLKTVICTDDGSTGFKGTVVDYLVTLNEKKGYSLYCCGPYPMMKAVVSFADENKANCQVSFEQTMACGVGACMGCAVKRADGNGYYRVCREGPVFEPDELEWT